MTVFFGSAMILLIWCQRAVRDQGGFLHLLPSTLPLLPVFIQRVALLLCSVPFVLPRVARVIFSRNNYLTNDLFLASWRPPEYFNTVPDSSWVEFGVGGQIQANIVRRPQRHENTA